MDQNRLRSLLVVSALCAPFWGLNAQGNPIQNTSDGSNYETISAAIQQAESGDVIVLGPLTFEERLLIQQPLTIIGDAGGGMEASGMASPRHGDDVLSVSLLLLSPAIDSLRSRRVRER